MWYTSKYQNLTCDLDFDCFLLIMPGASNMVCGLLGAGFTGSYIFSQTIFSMRADVKSKWHGAIVAGKSSLRRRDCTCSSNEYYSYRLFVSRD